MRIGDSMPPWVVLICSAYKASNDTSHVCLSIPQITPERFQSMDCMQKNYCAGHAQHAAQESSKAVM